MTVKPGLEVLCDDEFKALAGKRVGLLTNASAVDRSLRSAISRFKASDQIKLTALFAPEHGIEVSAIAGAKIESTRAGDLPIYSLYGSTQRPTAEMLDQVDVIVCDLQDIGARYDTYIWTVSHVLEAAGERGLSVLILDRPNPLGGVIVDGPPLDAHLSSLVGRYPIPIRHGLTLGELAQLFNARWNVKPAALDVIPCEGWRRAMLWDATGLAFVPPTPNLAHFETVQHYPGACLIEGTNLSEGRGTPLPFEIAGAPFIDANALADHLNAQNLPGVRFRPQRFQPSASKWAGEVCGGVQAHIVDLSRWRAIRVWLALIEAVHTLYPTQFAWQPPDSSDVHHFDRLIGSTEPRRHIDAGEPLTDLFAAWDTFSHDFEVDRWSYLLYM